MPLQRATACKTRGLYPGTLSTRHTPAHASTPHQACHCNADGLHNTGAPPPHTQHAAHASALACTSPIRASATRLASCTPQGLCPGTPSRDAHASTRTHVSDACLCIADGTARGVCPGTLTTLHTPALAHARLRDAPTQRVYRHAPHGASAPTPPTCCARQRSRMHVSHTCLCGLAPPACSRRPRAHASTSPIRASATHPTACSRRPRAHVCTSPIRASATHLTARPTRGLCSTGSTLTMRHTPALTHARLPHVPLPRVWRHAHYKASAPARPLCNTRPWLRPANQAALARAFACTSPIRASAAHSCDARATSALRHPHARAARAGSPTSVLRPPVHVVLALPASAPPAHSHRPSAHACTSPIRVSATRGTVRPTRGLCSYTLILRHTPALTHARLPYVPLLRVWRYAPHKPLPRHALS